MGKFFITFLLLSISFLLLGQTEKQHNYMATIRHLNMEDGLSSRGITYIHKDRRGLIWLGSTRGINRYDGREFRWFTKEKDGLYGDYVYRIVEDDEGLLWITFKLNPGISVIDSYSGKVIAFEDKFKNAPFNHKDIINAASVHGIVYLHLKGQRYFKYTTKGGFEKFIVDIANINYHPFHSLVLSSDTILWGVRYTSLRQNEVLGINPQGKIIQQHIIDLDNVLVYLGQDKDYNSWIDMRQANKPIRLLKLTKDGKDANYHYPDDVKLKSNGYFAFRQKDDIMFYTSDKHLTAFHLEKGLVYSTKEENFSETPIKSSISYNFFDEKGILWATSPSGFYIIQLKENPFKRLLYTNTKGDDLSVFQSCRSILKDSKGRLFINNYSKGAILQMGEKTLYSDELQERTPLSILEDKEGNIWFGHLSNRLARLDAKTNQLQIFDFDELLKEKIGRIWSLYEDEQDRIWFGGVHQIGYFDKKSEKIILINKYNGFEELKEGTNIYAIQQLKDGTIWLSTSRGLYQFDLEKGILDRKWEGGKGNAYIPAKEFYHLYEDKEAKNVVWLATYDGLLRWKRGAEQEDSIQQFTAADGLNSNSLNALYGDDYGNLWISSLDGLMRFNKKSHQVTTYLPNDGITHYEFNRISHHQDQEGTIYFGGINGVTAFHPRDFHNRTLQDTIGLPLIITDFEQFSGETDQLENRTRILSETQKIVLKPNDRFFELRFTLGDYINNDKIRYAYIIDGFEAAWTERKENFIRVSGLPYGNYTLRVRAKLPNGTYAKNKLAIPIYVLRPFYLQWWFILLCVLSIIGTGYFIFLNRVRQFERQKILLEQKVEERTQTIQQQNLELQQDKQIIETQAQALRALDETKSRFFANVSHELRTPLTLIHGPIDAALKSNELGNKNFTLLSMAKLNVEQLKRRVDEILDLTKLESRKLEANKHPVNFYGIVQQLVASYEAHAHRQGIRFLLDYQLPTQLNILLDEDKFGKILHNFLSNAFKFTSIDGEILVLVKAVNPFIQLSVKDTGRGIPAADLPFIFDRFYQSKQNKNTLQESGTGIGLALCAEYAKLLDGKVWAESDFEHGKGSQFFFEFPKIEALQSIPVLKKEKAIIANTIKNQLVDNQANHSKQFPTVLVVEDNYQMLDYITIILKAQYNIKTATNGKAALTWLNDPSEKQPDLIISDIMMPEMDGFQLLNNIKSKNELRLIPIILLTARTELKDKLQGLRIGVDDYITKPFEQLELLARANNLVENDKMRKAFRKELATKENTTIPEGLSELEINWLKKLELTAKENMGDFDFTIDRLAHEMAISRTLLYKKTKQLTGLTPNQYLQEIRLIEALHLLETKKVDTVKSTAYAVGWRKVRHFSELFKKRFGKSPSVYL